MDPLDILPWVLAGLGILSFAGTATMIVKGASNESVRKTQKDSIEALVEWDKIKTQQIIELRAECETLRQKVVVLEGVANSRDEIAELRTALLKSITNVDTGLKAHNTVALERVDNVLASIGTLPKSIAGEIASEIVKAMKGGSP